MRIFLVKNPWAANHRQYLVTQNAGCKLSVWLLLRCPVRLRDSLCQLSGIWKKSRNFKSHSCNVFLEPLGVKAPNFSTDDRSSSFIRTINDSLTLQCPAQGYPVPMFRYICMTRKPWFFCAIVWNKKALSLLLRNKLD